MLERGGDPTSDHAVLAESQLQFGQLLGNDVGYACTIIVSHEKERDGGDTTQSPLMGNKDALVSYARLFPPMVTAIARRRIGERAASQWGAWMTSWWGLASTATSRSSPCMRRRTVRVKRKCNECLCVK